MKQLVCILCPKGCRMRVDPDRDYAVSGHSCERGERYAREELLHPVRVLTSTVRVEGGVLRRCPVKTDKPIPKGKMFEAVRLLDHLHLEAPVVCGQPVVEDILGTGSNLIATRSVGES